MFDSEALEGWEEFLSEFREKVYPVFASHQISFEAAIQIYHTNMLRNDIGELIETLDDKEKFN